MGEILTFTPRPKQAAPELPGPVSTTEMRAEIEAGAQAALDMADRFIAILDRLEEDPGRKEDGDAVPVSSEPEITTGSQVVYMRDNDQDREAEAPEAILPEAVAEPAPDPIVIPWRGRGNIIAAVGVALLDMVASR